MTSRQKCAKIQNTQLVIFGPFLGDEHIEFPGQDTELLFPCTALKKVNTVDGPDPSIDHWHLIAYACAALKEQNSKHTSTLELH